MMKRFHTMLLAILLVPVVATAQTSSIPRFTYGAEWGYIGIFFSGYHFNFFAPEGYRVDPRYNEFTFISNGEAYLHAGYNISDKYNLSAYMGLSAIGEYHHTVPVSLRLTRYYRENAQKDRWLAFIDVGSGISIKDTPQALLSGKIGLGYRISLSRSTKLDLIAALRSVLTHPDIDYYGTMIQHDRINRNNAYVSAFSIGLSLTL